MAALAQQDVGSNDDAKVDVMPLPCRHSSTALNHSRGRISVLPREMPKLPPKREQRTWRILRHRLLSAYHRLFFVVFITNMVACIVVLVRNRDAHTLALKASDLGTAAAANVLTAILIRQEIVIIVLYNMCCMTPIWWPLRVRRAMAKIYHFGGVHRLQEFILQDSCGT